MSGAFADVGVGVAVTVFILANDSLCSRIAFVGLRPDEGDAVSVATVTLRLRSFSRPPRVLPLRERLVLRLCRDDRFLRGESPYSSDDGSLSSVEAGDGESSSSLSSSVQVSWPATRDKGDGCTLALRWVQ